MSRQQLTTLGVGIGVGAALAWFLDPDSGARRRNMTRDRTFATVRRAARRAKRVGRGTAAEAYGLSMKATHLREQRKEFDDVTLARKIESEIFRSPDFPKGRINLNAVDGVVYLRGEVPSAELIDDLVAKVSRVQGVKEITNLLHVPGEPAPSDA